MFVLLCWRKLKEDARKRKKRNIKERNREDFDGWVQFISEVGFPFFVTAFVFTRLENKFDALRISIENLPEQIKKQLTS